MDSGGAEQTALDIAAAIVKAGGRSLIATSGGRLSDKLKAAGAEVLPLPLNTKNPLTLLMNTFRLSHLIDEYNVNIVHARSRAPAWSAYLAARIRNTPFVTTYHGVYRGRSFWKQYYNSVMVKGDRVIANSSFTADSIVKQYRLPAQKIVTIPRGVDVTAFDPEAVSIQRQRRILSEWGHAADSGRIILLPGRYSQWKGQTVLIEAAHHLRSFGRSDFVCILAGDSRGRSTFDESLRSAVETLGLEGIVKIVGHCSDMPAALAVSTVAVSASTEPEAFGRVAVEAQAMGKPVVVTDHGAARETVVDGETGWRVTPGDSHALALALDSILGMPPDVRKKFGSAGRNRVSKYYSVSQMCDKTITLYKELYRQANRGKQAREE